jgi:hypothetical protein
LGAEPLAIEYANRLASLQLDEKSLVKLGLAVGSARLIQMATNDKLEEGPRKFAVRVLEAVRKFRRDPKRLEKLALQAAQSAAAERSYAVNDLRLAGGVSVQPLVRLLADPQQAKSAANVRDALAQLGTPAVEPLLAVLQTADQQLQAQVLLTLARLAEASSIYDVLCHAAMPSTGTAHRRAARLAIAELAAQVPDAGTAKRKVYTAINELLTGRKRLRKDLEERSPLWNWDDDKRELTRRDLPERHVAAAIADRLASQLYRVDPDDQRLARLAALTRLNRAKLFGGLDQPVKPAVVEAVKRLAPADPLDFVEQVLALALRREQAPAAIAAAEILAAEAEAAEGAPHLTNHSAPAPTPLVRALVHPDRRLRFAALQAVVAARPDALFAGASGVPQALEFFIHCADPPRALVADPRPFRGQLTVAQLTENGWQGDQFYSGRKTLLAAKRRADYAVAFVAFAVEEPDSRDTLACLREDPRTAHLPVGLIIEPKHRLAAEVLVDQFPLTETFVVPRDGSTTQRRLDQLIATAGDRFVPHAVRMQQAAASIDLLARLSERRPPLFELAGFEPALELALYNPQLATAATAALAALGSPAAQQALVNAASAAALPLTIRQQASKAFVASIGQHGIGLSIAQIQQLNRLYDQQADDGAETEALMWSMLDALQTVKR